MDLPFHGGCQCGAFAMNARRNLPGSIIAIARTANSPIHVCSSGRLTHPSLKAGSLDDPSTLKATDQIRVSGAVSWHDTCLTANKHPKAAAG